MAEARRHGAHRVGSCRVGGFLGLVVVLSGVAAGHASRPATFHQAQPAPASPGLVGTSITDVVWSGRYLWVATERGLARFDPALGSGLQPEDWVTFTDEHGLGRGSVSALTAAGDTVWAATLYDTLVASQGRSFQVGSGLSWSTDGGTSWTHLSNAALFDTTRAGFEAGPTTPILNPCFGLAVQGDTVWAAFLAGSTVRSTDFGRTWERVLPGGAERIVFLATDNQGDVALLRFEADSLEAAGAVPDSVAAVRAAADSLAGFFLLHRTFSVAAYGDTVWIGTSNGLVSSFDFGRTWRQHRVRLDAAGQPLPGKPGANWTVTVEHEVTADGGSLVWTGTRVVDPATERESMNFSADGGVTWQSTGPGSAWDFAFTGGDSVWAGTDLGLLLSPDHGATWVQVPVEDPDTRDALRPTFVGVERFALPDGRISLWAGADNGLGRSLDGGRTWTILSFPVKTRTLDGDEILGEPVYVTGVDEFGQLDYADGDERTYAAPSPFSPTAGEGCRIVYSLATDARISIDIYDLASRHVRSLVSGQDRAGGRNHGETWDGRDDDGRPVANGVYLFRVETDSGAQAFGNVVVLD